MARAWGIFQKYAARNRVHLEPGFSKDWDERILRINDVVQSRLQGCFLLVAARFARRIAEGSPHTLV